MKKIFIVIISLLCVSCKLNSNLTSNKHVKAQQMDTIYFYTPELKVNNQYFLHDLDSILLQHCSKCDTNKVYLIEIDQKRMYVYHLNVTGTLWWEFAEYSKGYFMVNNKYCFVKGILPDSPKPLFTQTDNISQFFYEKPHYDPNDFWIFADGDCCSLLLEYRYQKLFFLKNLWEQ